MMVNKKPKVWELFFRVRGTVLPRIWPQILVVGLASLLVTLLEQQGLLHITPIAALPFSLMGIALSIFSAFCNTASYDRWWEARKVLGQMLIDTRNITRQSQAYLASDPLAARQQARYAMAFADSLRCHLRDEVPDEQALQYLDANQRQQVLASKHAPNRILAWMSQTIAMALSNGHIAPQMAQELEERVTSLAVVLGAAERIKTTPLPYAYSLLLHRTAYLFCFLLPLGMGGSLGMWTPLFVVILSYTFFGLDALGSELLTPFGTTPNSLPMQTICRTIEKNILEELSASNRH
ncbi:bestrophin family protein [Neisseriaceae bacterium TC5R-5]|nr:bestrophin family protein [Neisseriaceae bacterium TC5R-5]